VADSFVPDFKAAMSRYGYLVGKMFDAETAAAAE